MSDETCAERIGEQLASREEYVAELFARIDDGDDEATEELDVLPLSVDVERTVVILLSTGGPHDELRATVDSDGDLVRVVYRFADWHDVAETTVPEGSSLWSYAESIVELVGMGGELS